LSGTGTSWRPLLVGGLNKTAANVVSHNGAVRIGVSFGQSCGTFPIPSFPPPADRIEAQNSRAHYERRSLHEMWGRAAAEIEYFTL